MPMCVTFADDTTVEDDGRMTRDEFFTHLANDPKLPRTSQPTPAAFMEAYADAELAGEEAVVITVAAKLSGHLPERQAGCRRCGYQGVCHRLRDRHPGRGADRARGRCRLREEGLTAGEIAEALERFKKRIRIVAVVDSLKHLHKGGRIPAAVAIVGGALGIKRSSPCMDSTVKLAGKGRGRPGAMVAMFKQLDELGGIDTDYPCVVLYSDEKQLAGPVHHYLAQNLKIGGALTCQIGATIGTHVGPRATGVAFVAKEAD